MTPDDSDPEHRSGDEHTRKIVHLTVAEIFDGVGLDFSTPAGRQELRADIAFLRDARTGTALIKKTFWAGLLAAGGTLFYKSWAAIALWMAKP